MLSFSVIGELEADRTASGAVAAPENSVNSNNNVQVKADENGCNLAALQMSFGVLQIAEPPLVRVRAQLKELMYVMF